MGVREEERHKKLGRKQTGERKGGEIQRDIDLSIYLSVFIYIYIYILYI